MEILRRGVLVTATLMAIAAAGEARAAPARCASVAVAANSAEPRLDISERAAAALVKSIRMACTRIGQMKAGRRTLEPSARRLGQVLASVLQVHPGLRSRDIGDAEFGTSPRGMGEATARHLREALKQARDPVTQRFQDIGCLSKPVPACLALSDLKAEINDAAEPVYQARPELRQLQHDERREEMRAAERKLAPEFRQEAILRRGTPPKGSVELTPAALSNLEATLATGRQRDQGCDFAALVWPGPIPPEAEGWAKTGPWPVQGAYYCHDAPDDVVHVFGDLRVVFQADEPGRFKDKIVDLENGKLVARRR